MVENAVLLLADTASAAPTVTAVRATRARGRPGPLSAKTLQLYDSDWTAFSTWCRSQDCPALPATPATVASYLAACAARLGPGALARRATAIANQHRQFGHPSPIADLAVKAVLREACRVRSTPRRAPSLPSARLARMAAACPGDLAGLRDRALLLLAATGLGRAALVGLDAEGVRLTPAGCDLLVRDRDGEAGPGRTVAVPRGAPLGACPVRALEDWLRASDCRFGPVFRKVDRWSNVEQQRLGTDAIRRIWDRRALRRPRHPPAASA